MLAVDVLGGERAWLDGLTAHRAARALAVGGPAGWRAVVAQHLLEEGPTELEDLGVVTRAGTTVHALGHVLDDERVVDLGDARTLQRVVRAGAVALRVREPGRAHETELVAYAPEPSWCVTATWQPLDEPRHFEIAYTIGTSAPRRSRGRLVFDVCGGTHALLAFDEDSGRLFVPFRDLTAGRTTYGAGRYLWCDPPGPDGKTVLDFNRTENPACAFTPHAACPFPPSENRLGIEVVVGERTPG